MPNRRAAVIAFVVFLALLVYVLTQKPGSGSAVVPTPLPKLLSLSPNQIVRIRVQSQEGNLVLSRDGDTRWYIQSPVAADADQQTVSNLISALCDLQISRSLPEDTGVSEDFGLEPPEFTIELTTDEGEPTVIEVGANNPDNTKRYVRLQGGATIHLVYPYQLNRLAGMIQQPPLPLTLTPEATGTFTAQ